ncbi:GYF domain-containing protein [Pseudoxanthomonas sp.]|uniref:GYF domain-containing protein n=1 Tax=Pseudoxanthomonas sp. TaxID=1871049 RepID=UPI002629F75F|nr:GYF domain-containing protein [Pseudoxanthomonas sp.]WDS37847.1 MAG: GYF domain-containing protein [Pseudoxanthomonas sp.]
MTQWYYSNGGPPQGPLAEQALAAEFRAGRLQSQHLVWREGLPEWQTLTSCMAELGLATAIPPPPPVLPPPPPLPPRTSPASPAGPLPRRGLSGCAIAALVVAGCAIPVLAILAAIAIPAYQGYVSRAAVAQAMSSASPAKLQLQMSMIGQPAGQCPVNGQGALRAPEDYADQGLASITFGKFESGDCGLQLVLRQHQHRQLDGKRIWLELEPGLAGGWRCHSELKDKYLPASCRSAQH